MKKLISHMIILTLILQQVSFVIPVINAASTVEYGDGQEKTISANRTYYQDLIPQSIQVLSSQTWKINGKTVPLSGYALGDLRYGDVGCRTFAGEVYKEIWDDTFTSYWKTTDDMLRNISSLNDRKITAENAKAFLMAASPGASVRIQSSNLEGSDSGGDPQHSFILLEANNTGCTIYESIGGTTGIRTRTYTWSDFASLLGKYTYFKYIKYPNASAYSSTSSTIPVTGITLSSALVVTSKDTQLTATVSPSNASNKTVTWKSSNTSVATVNSSGFVKIVGDSGSAIITATTQDGGKTANCSISILNLGTGNPVTSVSLNKSTLSMEESETTTLAQTVSPSNATDDTVTWKSSDTSVATVSSSGKVTAMGEGTATITVTTTDGGKTATCKVTVSEIEKTIYVTSISLNKSSLSLEEGETTTLAQTVSPSNATDDSVTWKSSDTSVATVNSSGKVTAIGEGTATITVTTTDGGKTATCKVTVSEIEKTIYVTSISLNKSSLSLEEGETTTLAQTVSPSEATDDSVTWKSSDTSVATVSSSGKVTAIGKGTATITVTTTDSDKTATCTVTVAEIDKTIPVTSVSLNKTSLTLSINDSTTLKSTISPYNATNDAVTWLSSNSSVATVSSTGVVKAVKSGSATITATSVDGGKKATCTVTVPNDTSVEIKQFTDVKTVDWYYNSVQFVLEAGLMSGTNSNYFSPDDVATRGMIVAILYNLAEKPNISGTLKFSDVKSSDYYAAAVLWAYENEIVSGVSTTSFAPHDSITREQLMAILYGYEKMTNGISGTNTISSSYTDRNSVSSWANDAVAWGIKHGLISGRSGNTISPSGTATRAEISTILKNYCNMDRDTSTEDLLSKEVGKIYQLTPTIIIGNLTTGNLTTVTTNSNISSLSLGGIVEVSYMGINNGTIAAVSIEQTEQQADIIGAYVTFAENSSLFEERHDFDKMVVEIGTTANLSEAEREVLQMRLQTSLSSLMPSTIFEFSTWAQLEAKGLTVYDPISGFDYYTEGAYRLIDLYELQNKWENNDHFEIGVHGDGSVVGTATLNSATGVYTTRITGTAG